MSSNALLSRPASGKWKRCASALLGGLLLSGCLGQLIIGHDVDPYLGRKWQDYDYAHPDAACGQPYQNKYHQQFVSCSTSQYTVEFHIDDDGVIQSYRGSLRD